MSVNTANLILNTANLGVITANLILNTANENP